MPSDSTHQGGRRPHFHRGRRGADRRGNERRTPQAHDQGGRDQVDVEQIMRDIRARISQRHGIDLSTQQIHELAARRLEAILDPRTIKPSLLEQLRRGAAEPVDIPSVELASGYTFEDTTLYESSRGFLTFIRRLLNPILKLFLNPAPLIHALNIQARVNREAVAREVERERRQAEWNALHYDILQRLVTEISRVSIEMQSLSMRVESLAGKVDFNDRRVRAMENTSQQSRPTPRAADSPIAMTPSPSEASIPAIAGETAGEGKGRRRRRRRGRRSSGGGDTTSSVAAAGIAPADDIGGEGDESGDEELASAVTTEGERVEFTSEPSVSAAPEASSIVETSVVVPEVEIPHEEQRPAAESATAASAEETTTEQPPSQPSPPRDEPSALPPADQPDLEPPDR